MFVDLSHEDMEWIAGEIPGGMRNLQDIYPLSPAQEGMLFQRLLHKQRDTYILSILFELEPEFATDLLVHALQSTIDRHDALRSAILWEELPQPVQVVCRSAPLRPNEI